MNEKIIKSALIYIKNKKILMSLNKGKDAFYIPGGKVEKNESIVDALIREIKEELDVAIIPETIKPYGVFSAQAYGKPEGVMVEMHCYTAEFKGEMHPCNEIQELAFYNYAQRKIVPPVDKIIFDDLKLKNFIE